MKMADMEHIKHFVAPEIDLLSMFYLSPYLNSVFDSWLNVNIKWFVVYESCSLT